MPPDTDEQNKAKASDLQMGMEMSLKSNKSRFGKQEIDVDFEGIEAI